MHSHYLVVESKESDDASKDRTLMLSKVMVGSKMKPGVFTVRDPQENVKYQVHCRMVGAPLRRTIDQVHLTENATDPNQMMKLQCNCSFYTRYNISCSHIMSVLTSH